MHTGRLIAAALALALAAGYARAQAPQRGDLLVATPELTGAAFAESVLLVIHHDENGSIGVLLNRPTWLAPAEVFPELAGRPALPERLFLGGPVQSASVLLLVRNPPPAAAGQVLVFDDVYVTGDTAILDAVGADAADESRVRIYAGQAQWRPGQLEAEIADGAWTVKPGRADLVFSGDVAGLWRQALTLDPALVVGVSPTGREAAPTRR